jgi:hypothetical protein
MPENSKKLLNGDSDELKLLTEVFKHCCTIKSNETIKVINSNSLGNINILNEK